MNVKIRKEVICVVATVLILGVYTAFGGTIISDTLMNTTGHLNATKIFQGPNQVIDKSGGSFNSGADLTGLDDVNSTDAFLSGDMTILTSGKKVCLNVACTSYINDTAVVLYTATHTLMIYNNGTHTVIE